MRLVFLALFCSAVSAHESYPASLGRVIDGDTVVLHVQSAPFQAPSVVTVRLDGIDAPELHGSTDCERTMAEASRGEVERLLRGQFNVVFKSIDKYGRFVASLIVDGESVSETLQRSGFARAYDGGKRMGWCK